MTHVAVVGRIALRVGGLVVVALLVPAPGDRSTAARRDEGHVLLDVGEVEIGIVVVRGHAHGIAARHGQRHRGIGLVGGDVRVLVAVARPGRLAAGRRRIELRAVEGLRVVDDRGALCLSGVLAARVALSVGAVLHPLGLARLPGDHRDGIRGRGRILGGEDVVEDGEAAGIGPEERDRVAIHVGHHEIGIVVRHGGALDAPRGDEAAVFGRRETVHAGDIVGPDVDLLGEALVAVVDAVRIGGVLLWPDAEGLRGAGLALPVGVALEEARSGGGVAGLQAIRIEAVHAGERAEFVVEGMVLVEDNEDVADLLAQRRDDLVARRGGGRGIDHIGLHGRRGIGLEMHERRGRGHAGRRRLGRGDPRQAADQ